MSAAVSMQRNGARSVPPMRTFCCPRCDGLSDQLLALAREAASQSQHILREELGRWVEGEDGVPFIKPLTRSERKLFTALWCGRRRFVPYDALHRAVYGHGIRMEADCHRIRVITSRLRAKIVPLGYQVTTTTGYGLRLDVPTETNGETP